MKTPREILLERHRSAEPNLDAIRKSAVAAVCDRRMSVHERRSQTAATRIFQTIWQELILPSRRVWSGLAAVWVLIIAVNLLGHDSAPAGKASAAPVMMSLGEQQRLLNELFADRSPAMDADRAKTFSPKPRTEKFQTFTA